MKKPRKPYKRKRKKPVRWWKPNPKATVTSLITQGHEPKCKCCGDIHTLTFDHILPKSKGGKDTLQNGQILCFRCNNLKADRKISLQDLRNEIAEPRTK